MSIWFNAVDIDQVNAFSNKGLTHTLAIHIDEITDHQLKGSMPVTEAVLQPMGLLHGGATISLGETLASIAAYLTIDPQKYACVGQHIDANHIKSATNGVVSGTASLVHKGRRSQLWDVEICNENNEIISLIRIGMAIIHR